MDLGLTGKVAMITGGSHGLGRATATALATEGVRVAICGRHADTLQNAAKEIEGETGGSVLPVAADVADPRDLEQFVAACTDLFGPPDILVNNADSASRQGEFFDLTDDDWMEKIQIKLMVPIRLIRLVAPAMMERGWGRIISMSGGTTRLMIPNGMPKGAAQAGLINLSKKLAVTLGHHGITVNVVEPGKLWTDGETVASRSRYAIRRGEVERAAAERGLSFEEMDRQVQEQLVLGRRIDVRESAGVIVFLASERAATITGEVVLADGGESRYVRY